MLLQPILLACFLGILVHATGPDVTFNCKHIPEVCTNMCWAMRCAKPSFPQNLTWDSHLVSDVASYFFNLKQSGCKVGNNRCNTGRKGIGHVGGMFRVCDEYPFYFTLENVSAKSQAVSRCVRMSRNALQHSWMRPKFAAWQKAGLERHRLLVGIANPGAKGVNYCLDQPCLNDGFEIQDGIAKMERVDKIYDRSEPPKQFRFWNTSSGVVMASLDPLTKGAKFERPSYAWGEESISGDRLEARNELQDELVDDVVMEEVSVEQAAIQVFESGPNEDGMGNPS